MYGGVPPDAALAVTVMLWWISRTFVDGIAVPGALMVGLTVNTEFAVCTSGEDALSVTEAVNVVEQLLVSTEFAVNTIVFEPSAARLFDVALREPQSGFEVEYVKAKEGVPPETVVWRLRFCPASKALLVGETETASAGFIVNVLESSMVFPMFIGVPP